MSDHSVKYWVWNQHGDAEYIWSTDNTVIGAVMQFAENRQARYGTVLYAAPADEVRAFMVGVGPRA